MSSPYRSGGPRIARLANPSSSGAGGFELFWREGDDSKMDAGVGPADPPVQLLRHRGKLQILAKGLAEPPKKTARWYSVEARSGVGAFNGGPALAIQSTAEHAIIFAYLADFLCRKITPKTDNPAAVAAEALTGWQKYLTSLRAEESISVGLHGELYTLSSLIEACGAEAVTWWTGPEMLPKDFSIPRNQGDPWGLEIKTTGEEPDFIHINGTQQTRPPGELLIIATVLDHSAGITLSQRVEELRSLVKEDADASELLETKLEKVGYEPDSDVDVPRRITGIRREDLASLPQVSVSGEGVRAGWVSRLKYQLDVRGMLEEVPVDGLGERLQGVRGE